ncbi:MAG: DsbC family protein [Burkholderiaceae bacterium]
MNFVFRPLGSAQLFIAAMLAVSWFASGAFAQTQSAPTAAQILTPGATTSTNNANNAGGAPVVDATLKKNLETRLGATIDSITRLPVAGLYEIRIDNDIFYADATGNYIVVGNLIDLRSRENLTRKRVEAIKQASLPQIKFADLPLDTAVKVVKGNGKRQVAIFEDPNCGYCKRLEKSIHDIGDVTIYVFLYPILGPDSRAKSKQVWCAANRSKAWSDWMQSGTALTGEGACQTPIDKTLELGKKLKVEGTPTLFFSNNKRVEGAIDTAELEKLLAG